MPIYRERDPVVWLQKLVACPSVNPRGKLVDGPTFGEARLNTLLSLITRRFGVSF